ncbi:hypothetical protein [Microbacterium sp. Root553]|uniref:hypothetical protein n=1 Tax=Microbacterium sp. Root553 TaxID=1736556 RepID=UPI0006F8048A|nr:hypothetical protein [Microbacterium sp. Root553]KQZ23921.1 hypothetical protein ASD43_05805 [Microbacterium sp. Root553]
MAGVPGDKDPKKIRFVRWFRRNVHWVRTLLMGVVIFCAMAAVFMWWATPAAKVTSHGENWVILVLVALIFLIGRLFVSDKSLRLGGKALGERHIYDKWESTGDALVLGDQYVSTVVLTDLYSCVIPATTALTSPATFTERITERRELGDERISVTMVRTFSGAKDLRAVPALRVEKGTLIGSLSVAVDGKASRTLTHGQARGLMIVCLYILHDEVLPSSSPFMTKAIPAVLADKPITDDELAHLLSHIDDVERTSGETDATRALRVLTRLVTTCDFVFVVAPEGCDKPTKVSISYQEPHGARVRTAGAWIRRTLGLGRRDYLTDLHTASESPSYHLDIAGPDGMFVQNSHVILPHDGQTVRPTAVGASTPRERAELVFIRSPRGDSGIHLYARDMDGSPVVVADPSSKRKVAVKPQFVVELRERPPGILGPTFVLSFWIAAVTWVVGVNYEVVFPTVTTPGSAWPAVIFGVPALVAGWLLSKLTKEVLRVISIATFLCVAWVSLNAAFVVTLAALKTTGISLGGFSLWNIHLHHPTWALAMFLTGFNLLVCLWLFIVRNARYASTINERAN